MGGSKTTTVQSNDPWAPAQPYILAGLDQTNKVFQQNQPNLQAMSNSAYDAYNSIAPGAFSTSPLVVNAQAAAQAIGSGAYLGTNPGASTYAGIMAGGANPAAAGPADLASTGGAASPSAQYYADVLSGKYLGGSPYLDGIVQQGTDAATRAVNARMAASGLGAGLSTAYTDLLGKDVANAANQLRYSDYDNQLNRMSAVGAQADAATNAANQIRLGASTALGSQYLEGQQNQLTAASQADAARQALQAQQLTALGLTPDLMQAQYAGVSPALSLLSEAASIPYTGIAAYNGGITGLSSGYGTQTTNSTTTNDLGAGLLGLGGKVASGFGGSFGTSLGNYLFK